MTILRNTERLLQHWFRVNAGLERRCGRCDGYTLPNRIVAAPQHQNTLLKKLAGKVHVALLQNALRVRLLEEKRASETEKHE